MPRRFKLKPFEPTEFSEQEHVFAWAKLRENSCPQLKLLHASLNGVRLPIGLAVKAKRAGMKQGLPDLFLPVVTYTQDSDFETAHWPGLYIELKRNKTGRMSEAQGWWFSELRMQGYKVVLCHGATEAIKEICQYLGIKP